MKQYNDLSPEESRVILNKWTEPAFSGEYYDNHDNGVYLCRQCNTPLYVSDDKFDSRCGWPSFDQAIPGRVTMTSDADGHRTEITCTTCGGHLWHVFIGEQMTEANTRHCVNSLSMKFVPQDKLGEKWVSIPHYHSVIVGWGCFWCIEGAMSRVPGVIECISWYAWWPRPNPSYEQVCTWSSGHIEVVKIWYDKSIIWLEEVLSYFMAIHDPSSMDKQWWDAGKQYRSVIIANSPDQLHAIQEFITKLDASWVYDSPIVTQIMESQKFWIAEWYHQNFYTNNPDKPYCQMVVKPKLEKIIKLT